MQFTDESLMWTLLEPPESVARALEATCGIPGMRGMSNALGELEMAASAAHLVAMGIESTALAVWRAHTSIDELARTLDPASGLSARLGLESGHQDQGIAAVLEIMGGTHLAADALRGLQSPTLRLLEEQEERRQFEDLINNLRGRTTETFPSHGIEPSEPIFAQPPPEFKRQDCARCADTQEAEERLAERQAQMMRLLLEILRRLPPRDPEA